MKPFKVGDELICIRQYTCQHMIYTPGKTYKIVEDCGISFILHSNNDGVVINRADFLNDAMKQYFVHKGPRAVNTEEDYYSWLAERLV